MTCTENNSTKPDIRASENILGFKLCAEAEKFFQTSCQRYTLRAIFLQMKIASDLRQHNIPTLLQIMACRLFGAKPLSEPMLPYCQLDPTEHISMKFYSKFRSFHSRKYTRKCRLRNGGHFVSAWMCWGMDKSMYLQHILFCRMQLKQNFAHTKTTRPSWCAQNLVIIILEKKK